MEKNECIFVIKPLKQKQRDQHRQKKKAIRKRKQESKEIHREKKIKNLKPKKSIKNDIDTEKKQKEKDRLNKQHKIEYTKLCCTFLIFNEKRCNNPLLPSPMSLLNIFLHRRYQGGYRRNIN